MHKYGTIANRKMEMAKSLHLPQCIISSNSYLHACLKIIVFPVFVATHLHQHILYLSFILGVPEYDTTQTRIASWIFKEKCASKKPELQALPPVMPPNMPAPLYPWQLQPFWPFLLITNDGHWRVDVLLMGFLFMSCGSAVLWCWAMMACYEWGALSLRLSSSPLQLISTGSSSALLEPRISSNQIPRFQTTRPQPTTS